MQAATLCLVSCNLVFQSPLMAQSRHDGVQDVRFGPEAEVHVPLAVLPIR